MINLTVLGATGSIGKSTLEVVRLHKNKFNIFALSAHSNWQLILELCLEFQPKFVVLTDKKAFDLLQKNNTTTTKILFGAKALDEVAQHQKTDYVMAAIVGSAGMSSTLAAANSGKRILLANKESLVLAGNVLLTAANKSGATIIPVDSEHSAIFQCLQGGKQGLSKIQLTASGGPFLNKPLSELKNITPDEACNHPNWEMGRKISVDSATMMNKCLEIIEAHYLFSMDIDNIDVVVHPESIIHSSVYYNDGSVISQLGIPDMRSAISYALFFPNRNISGVQPLDLTKKPLTFLKPDLEKFKSLTLVNKILKINHNSILGVFNAANEEAVKLFLNKKISFLEIIALVEEVINNHQPKTLTTLDAIVENDSATRANIQSLF
ncbi:1-deoxy-D-xylulose 5-phosphate reductoisomerase [hydrothermal vent metagenome]|uniref:1-deoxy-D-xylulose-5-phosphate reductoisomerase n=1 Tax=hydrothermal vent metagenome TaxID=652676 RepID=A0A1W1BIK7_9ZZZZ